MLRLLAAAITVAGLSAGIGHAQVAQLSCAGTAAPAVIRAEGLAERVGDIVLTCQSNTPNADIAVGAVQVVLSAPVANGSGAVLTVLRGGAVVHTLSGEQSGSNIISFPAITSAVDAQGQATIRITNVRVNATGRTGQQITALIGSTGNGLGVSPNPVTPAVVQPGLLVNSTVTNIFCGGSPAPRGETLTLAALFSAGTAVSTLRATEGSSNAFQIRTGGADMGTRLLVQLSGFPEGARVYLPSVIAGSSATRPTSVGELGLAPSAGRYTPGATGSLLLSQVAGASANGVGGVPVYRPDAPGTGTISLTDAREIPLTAGAGVAVFEVVDSNSTVFESAQIPVFVSVPSQTGIGAIAQAKVVFGPISTGTETPRFQANQTPGLDCPVLNDCDANYFPKLEVEAPALQFSGQVGTQAYLSKRVIVRNARGGLMPWKARWVYENGSGWLNIVVPTGVNTAAFQLDALIDKITAPGVYRATLIVDAGPLAGTAQFPVTFEVTAGAPAAVAPVISEAFNSADSTLTTLAPGSRAVMRGLRFPENATVTFNGIDAPVIANAPERIEVLVPETLGPATAAPVRVIAPTATSAPYDVNLAAAAPAIYPNGIFNQDNSPNTASVPEQPGRILQVFATGLPTEAAGRIMAKVQGDTDSVTATDLPYAGGAPGYPGVQQVNVRVPVDLPAGAAHLLLCGTSASTGVETCSPPVRLYLTLE